MNNRSEQEIMDSINTSLDRIEATMYDMQYKLERIAKELGVGGDKENGMNKSRTSTTYDVNVVYNTK
jgi:hypothetical protein